MAYVDGCDLSQLVKDLTKRGVIQDGRLPPEVVVYIGVGLLEALAYAHRGGEGRAGVVHRDVSPHNLMLTREGSVKLNDFGIAKSTHEGGQIDKTQHAVGKPLYMSPEQFQGAPLDGRTDLFAVGVTLYELLTGVSPFAAYGNPNENVGMLMMRVFQGHRPPLAQLAPHAPAALIEVVEALLQPNRDYRPASAEVVLEKLDALASHRSKRVLAEPCAPSRTTAPAPSRSPFSTRCASPRCRPKRTSPRVGRSSSPPAPPPQPGARPLPCPHPRGGAGVRRALPDRGSGHAEVFTHPRDRHRPPRPPPRRTRRLRRRPLLAWQRPRRPARGPRNRGARAHARPHARSRSAPGGAARAGRREHRPALRGSRPRPHSPRRGASGAGPHAHTVDALSRISGAPRTGAIPTRRTVHRDR